MKRYVLKSENVLPDSVTAIQPTNVEGLARVIYNLPEGGVYVVHTTLDQRRFLYVSYKSAFKKFKESRKTGQAVALWHGPRWTKLAENGYYPELLREPYGPFIIMDRSKSHG